jgi:single-strand DNA-binding protein
MTTEPNEQLIRPTNVVVVRGPVRGTPTSRELPSGSTVLQFDVATVVDDPGAPTGRTTTTTVSVPVSWTDPGDAAVVVEGAELVVTGTVRRRFFRVGGATQSRTEIVADAVIPTRRRKQVADALTALAGRLVG